MNFLSLAKRRRSIRKFKPKSIGRQEIKKILESGRWAPSGLNNQPWRFLVIEDQMVKEGLARFTKYRTILTSAPVLIVVCMDVADSYNREKDLMAIGACIENMLLQVTSAKLGACWLGEILNKKEEVKQYLNFDKDIELMAVIALGYPNEKIGSGCRNQLKKLMIKRN